MEFLEKYKKTSSLWKDKEILKVVMCTIVSPLNKWNEADNGFMDLNFTSTCRRFIFTDM